MHTFKHGETIFWHNGGFDGDVEIGFEGEGPRITVPFSALRALVAEHVRREKIAALEQANAIELLGLPPTVCGHDLLEDANAMLFGLAKQCADCGTVVVAR